MWLVDVVVECMCWVVTHLVYGEPATINSANFVYFKAMEACNRLGNAAATQAFLGMLRIRMLWMLWMLWMMTMVCECRGNDTAASWTGLRYLLA
jgi:hypothetical protein